MELIIGLLVVIVLLVALDLAAMRWGVNSRSTVNDWKTRRESEDYPLQGFRY